MNKTPVVKFSYKIKDILDEVTKRTSYVGKMRSTEQEPFLVDRLSLTSGENFMFKEFIDNAANETYEWVKAFGRKINPYDKVGLNYTDTHIYKNHGVSVVDANGNEYETGKYIQLNSTFTFQPNISNKFLRISFDSFKCVNVKGIDTTLNVKYRFVIHSTFGGILSDAEAKEHESNYYTNINVATSMYNITYERAFDEVVDKIETFVKFEVVPNTPEDISKDTFIEYRTDFNDDSVFDLYKADSDCNSKDWLEHSVLLEYDPREVITFFLERKEHFDMNMITIVDRYIKEAIVNHVIYQWFEYVNTPEADKYLLKFEDFGHKAQIGMNARTKNLQRKYKLF